MMCLLVGVRTLVRRLFQGGGSFGGSLVAYAAPRWMRSNESPDVASRSALSAVSTLVLMGTPRSPLRILLAATSLVKKSMTLAASLACWLPAVMARYCDGFM